MSDRDVQELKRRLEADPANEALARELELALLRDGRDDEVLRRYEQRLTCNLAWRDLEEDARGTELERCQKCVKSVRYVRDVVEATRYLAAHRGYIAGSPSLLRDLAQRAVDQLKRGATPEPVPSCFVVCADEDAPRWLRRRCTCLARRHETRFHEDLQDTECDAWKRLLELIEVAADDGRVEFSPAEALGPEQWFDIVTLPPTIAKLKRVQTLQLYGSQLVSIPPEIGEMTALTTFTPYTSYRLHWFPYEITRCRNLARSTVSTRALYGNYKHRPIFPNLKFERGPSGRTCSVCDRPANGFRQVWLSLRVATDVLPLLVNACSQRCIDALPGPAEGYVPRPHRGGHGVAQPPAQD